MVFIIHRRGLAIHEYASSILNTTLFESDNLDGQNRVDDSVQKLTRAQTAESFRAYEPKPLDVFGKGNSQYREDMYMRLKTGGPLFYLL